MNYFKIDKEFKSLIPPLSKDEYEKLEGNLKKEGCLSPLIVWDEESILLDGHTRFEICERLNIKYKVERIPLLDRDSAKEFILRNQLGRRNLTDAQRVMVALALEPIIKNKSKEKQKRKPDSVKEQIPEQKPHVQTRDEVGKLAGVSGRTVDLVKTVKKSGIPELQDAMMEGGVSICKAAKIAVLTKEKQEEIVEKAQEEGFKNVSIVTEKPEVVKEAKKKKSRSIIPPQIISILGELEFEIKLLNEKKWGCYSRDVTRQSISDVAKTID
jgi:hypothetical protein